MLIRRSDDIAPSETTPERLYFDRRTFLAAAAGAGLGLAGSATASAPAQAPGKPYGLQPNDEPTPWEDVTGYDNFYEFGK